MTKRLTKPRAVRTYSQWRLEKLADPARAARYLNAAKRDSKEALLHALKNVIQANQVARTAREAGVSRESVYRSFSAEGNPTFDTLSAILEALDIEIAFAPVVHLASAAPQSGGKVKTVRAESGRHLHKVHVVVPGSVIKKVEIRPPSTGSEPSIDKLLGRVNPGVGSLRRFANLSSNGTVLPIPNVQPEQVIIPDYLNITSLVRTYGFGQDSAANSGSVSN